MNSEHPIDSRGTASHGGMGNSALLAAGAVAAAATLLTPRKAHAVSPALTFSDIPGTGDIQVLNYALALEDLETQLYLDALNRLTGGGTTSNNVSITGLQIGADQPDVIYLKAFAKVEAQHRQFLRTAINAAGGPTIPRFKYDFAIESKTRQQVLDLVLLAEQTGTGAYLGAIPFFATRSYLRAAGAIQGTEARHTAVLTQVANTLFSEGLPVAPLASTNNGIEMPLAPNAVLASISGFIIVS